MALSPFLKREEKSNKTLYLEFFGIVNMFPWSHLLIPDLIPFVFFMFAFPCPELCISSGFFCILYMDCILKELYHIT